MECSTPTRTTIACDYLTILLNLCLDCSEKNNMVTNVVQRTRNLQKTEKSVKKFYVIALEKRQYRCMVGTFAWIEEAVSSIFLVFFKGVFQ